MKVRNIITCALIATYSIFASAEVTLNAVKTINVLSVNASTPEKASGGLFSSSNQIFLPDGVNQIVFKYEPYFKSDATGKERTVTVSSNAIIARFEATDTELSFEVPEYRDEDDADSNIDNMVWSLKDKKGNTVPVVKEFLIKSGVQVGRNYSREAEDYNRKGKGVAVIAPFGAVVAASATAPVVGQTDTSNTAEEMLLFWYHKADDQTKARFKEYVNQ